MLCVIYDKLNDGRCQMCMQPKDTIVHVRFADGFKAKICTACLWRRVDLVKAEEAKETAVKSKSA